MKSMFIISTVISGAISFVCVKKLRENEQMKFDRKMKAVDDWMSKSMLLK